MKSALRAISGVLFFVGAVFLFVLFSSTVDGKMIDNQTPYNATGLMFLGSIAASSLARSMEDSAKTKDDHLESLM